MTQPSGPHLDLDALADLLAGEGTERQVVHLSSCVACSGALADLDAASAPLAAALGALPDPPPPADLDTRLAGALADAGPVSPAPVVASGAGGAEPEQGRPAAPAQPAPVRSTTVTPLRSRRLPWLPAAAASVLLLCAGGLVVALAGRDGSSETASTAAPGSAAPQEDSAAAGALAGSAFNASGRDYAAPGALDAALPDVLAGRAVPAVPESAARSAPGAPPPAPASAPTGDGADQVTTPGLERLREPAALADCLRALLPPENPGAGPLALDYATYAGGPALLVVLPATDPAKLDAFVVGPECSAANDATLFFARLDRP